MGKIHSPVVHWAWFVSAVVEVNELSPTAEFSLALCHLPCLLPADSTADSNAISTNSQLDTYSSVRGGD